MSTFIKEYEQLFNRLMNLQTKKASLPDWVDDDTKVDKIYRPFHLGSLFSPRVTRFSKGPQRAYMIDLGRSFSPCFDTLEDLGRVCQTRNLAFCPVTFETSDEWGDFSKVTISRFVLKDFGEWEEFEWINDNGAFIWCKPWLSKAVYMPVGNTIIRG